MLYSSGTTGRPKGIKRALPDIRLDALDPRTELMMEGAYAYGEDMVYLSPAPMYHAAPLAFSIPVHRVGGTLVIMERFDASGSLAAIERYDVTHAQFVPTMFVRMLKLDDAERMRHGLSTLQVAIHAAAPCPVDVKHAMIEWWGPILYEYYAGTEGVGSTLINSHEWLERPGSVGQASLGTIHICDAEGNDLATGETGGIYFSGGGVFEYHKSPEKTADAMLDGGRGTLGDIGYVDEDGYLFLTDRRAHMIISGGVNIYPQEIEDAMIAHPSVMDVAVFGVPDAEMGEQVKAVVQPAPGVVADEALARELIAYARDRIAHYKCPRTSTSNLSYLAYRPGSSTNVCCVIVTGAPPTRGLFRHDVRRRNRQPCRSADGACPRLSIQQCPMGLEPRRVRQALSTAHGRTSGPRAL